MTLSDKEHYAAMKKLGVRWARGRAIPTYPVKMTQAQRIAADAHYDALSEAFIDQMGTTTKVHKGIYYFKTFTEAHDFAVANDLPTDRIISYQLGWAIQRSVSGPYWGPAGW